MSRAFRLGLFIVGTLAILAAGVFLIGDKQFLFSSTYPLTTTFKTVGGLNNGAEVRVGGVHQGTVKQIQLPTQAEGEMTVLMDLRKSTKQVIRTDSVATLQTEGLLGNKYVEISFGSPGAHNVDDDGTIAGTPPLEIADLIRKTNEILDTTTQTMGSVRESAERFKEISAKIDQGTGTVGALVNDRKVYAQLDQMTAQARTGAAAFQENMAALKHNFLLRGFFNLRGYEDSTKLTEHAIRELPHSPSLRTFTYEGSKLFANTNTAKLEREKTLNDAGRFLEEHPFGVAVVQAAGSMKGDVRDVQTLTQARAMVVRDYLVNHFRMDDTRVRTLGLGKNEQTTNDAGTVDIIVYPPGSAIAPAKVARAHQ